MPEHGTIRSDDYNENHLSHDQPQPQSHQQQNPPSNLQHQIQRKVSKPIQSSSSYTTFSLSNNPNPNSVPISPMAGAIQGGPPQTASEIIADHLNIADEAAQTAHEIDNHILEQLTKDNTPAAKSARRMAMFRAILGEFMCTTMFFGIVFSVICSLHRAGVPPNAAGPITAFAAALVACAVIFAFSNISGAQFNPVITFGNWLTKKTSNRKLIYFVAAQLLGSVAACIIVALVFPHPKDLFKLLAVKPATDDYVRVFFMEFFLSFAFCYTAYIMAFEDAEQQKKNHMSFQTIASTKGLSLYATSPQSKSGFAPFAIGFVQGALALCGGTVSGGAFNIARLFGPAIFSGIWDYFYVYYIAELLGGGSAALFVHYVHRWGKPQGDNAILANTAEKVIATAAINNLVKKRGSVMLPTAMSLAGRGSLLPGMAPVVGSLTSNNNNSAGTFAHPSNFGHVL